MAAFDGVSQLLSDVLSDQGLMAPMSLTRRSAGAYSPATGERAIAIAQEAFSAVVDALRRELVEGVSVQAGDLKLTVPSVELSQAPTTSDVIAYNGQDWSILAVVPVVAGSLVITYQIHARRT